MAMLARYRMIQWFIHALWYW